MIPINQDIFNLPDKKSRCMIFFLFLGLSAKPSAQSFSSLSSEASKMGSSTPSSSPPPNDASLYQKLLWSHQHDPKSKEDLVLNRRVGFYRFKSDIGAGNFSKVKLAQHQLTKGRMRLLFDHFQALLCVVEIH